MSTVSRREFVSTDVLKRLPGTCRYGGLMLPVLEHPVLAEGAADHRCSLRDLLLYSSVCGTGLDAVRFDDPLLTDCVVFDI